MEVRDMMLIGIAGFGVAGGILTNYLIKRNRPAEYYLAKEAESEASVEKYRLDLEYDAKEREKAREHELKFKKLANEREAALPNGYWLYKAAVENKEARKYEADKLDKLIDALSNTNCLKGYDDLSTGLYILARRTQRDEELIDEILELVKQIQIAGKTDDVELQKELLKKVEELKKDESFDEEMKKLDALKHKESLDFDFDALLHKEEA